MSVAEEREPEQIDAGARKSVFMRHFTYARALLLERTKFGETEREAWAKAKADHIHTEAARLVLRLTQMDSQKASAFLRSFDAYRGWAGLDRQVEMFPEHDKEQAEGAALKFFTESEVAPDPEQPERYQELTGELEITNYEVGFRIGPETPDSPPSDGRQACRLGIKATLNPYDPDDEPEAYEVWGDAWTGAYASGEWCVDLAEDPDDAT